MNISTKAILAVFFLVFFSTSILADVNKSEELQHDVEEQMSIATPTDPYDKWTQYLSNGNIKNGVNITNDGRIFIVSYGMVVVGKPLDDSQFMSSRNIAFDYALIDAKKQMSTYLNTELESERNLIASQFSDDVPNRLKKEVGEPLSIAAKAATLTGLSLDNEIKKFDPNWDGTKKSDQDRAVKMAEQVERYTAYLSSKSQMFLQGATPIFNAEGPVAGDYTVVVGIVWSVKSASVAESVYNPTVAPIQGRKNALTIQQRLDNFSDEKLAATLGLRIWWDEDGFPVIVSFAQAKGSGSATIARNITTNYANNQIAQFVAEQIVSSEVEKINQEIHYYKDGTSTTFNQDEYQLNIRARANRITLIGSEQVLYKKIKHPISNKRIVVNVMTWNPESNMIARGLIQMSEDQSTKMDATKNGDVFENFQESSSDQLNDQVKSAGGISSNGLEGVSSDPDDF